MVEYLWPKRRLNDVNMVVEVDATGGRGGVAVVAVGVTLWTAAQPTYIRSSCGWMCDCQMACMVLYCI